MKPLLIAHRGDTIHFPENTLDAFQSAFDLGAGGIECDIQLLEGKLIVIHDYLFDQTKTYPILKNVLEKFSHRGRIEIEVKSFTYDILSPLTHLLSQYPKGDFEITTSELFLVPELRKQLAQATIGVIFKASEFEPWMPDGFVERKIIETTKTLRTNVAHVSTSLISHDLVKKLHKEGIKVHTHLGISATVANYQEFCDLGVDQCTFDNINLLTEIRK